MKIERRTANETARNGVGPGKGIAIACPGVAPHLRAGAGRRRVIVLVFGRERLRIRHWPSRRMSDVECRRSKTEG